MRTANAHKSLPKMRAGLSRATEAVYRKASEYYKAGRRFELAGDEVNAARAYKKAEQLMRRGTRAGLAGPVGILPNPSSLKSKVQSRKNPLPVDEWDVDDIDEDAAFAEGARQAKALGRSVRAHAKEAKFYHVTWFSPARGKRTGFVRPIEAHNQAGAIQQAKAMITNDPKVSNFVAKEAKRNPARHATRQRQQVSAQRAQTLYAKAVQKFGHGSPQALRALTVWERRSNAIARRNPGSAIFMVPAMLNPKDFWTGKRVENPSGLQAEWAKRKKRVFHVGDRVALTMRYGDLYEHGNPYAVLAKEGKRYQIQSESTPALIGWTDPEYLDRVNPNSRLFGPNTCPECGRAAGAPFRTYDERGKVISGCVGNFHTGHLVTPSESSARHNRKEAKEIRKRLKQFRNPGLVDLAANLQAADFVSKFVGEKKRRNPDNASCPKCGHYNAMLFDRINADDSYRLKCRDCGFTAHVDPDATAAEIKRELRQAFLRKRNPSVTDLSKTFQGKASGAISEYKAANSAPSDLARIGKLVFFKLKGGKQTRIPGAMVGTDTRGKLWITAKRAPMFTRKAKPGSMLDFGEIDKICYETAKAHIENGRVTEYVHTFGEDGGKKPHLLVDAEGMAILRGGDYQIKSEGIVN